MKKVLTLEVWVDETMEDNRECVSEVIGSAMGHEYCCDGTVSIKVIDNIYEDKDDIKMAQERIKNDNGVRYTLEKIKKMRENIIKNSKKED